MVGIKRLHDLTSEGRRQKVTQPIQGEDTQIPTLAGELSISHCDGACWVACIFAVITEKYKLSHIRKEKILQL